MEGREAHSDRFRRRSRCRLEELLCARPRERNLCCQMLRCTSERMS